MTCRVARSLPNQTQIVEPIFCCECGLTHVEVLMASKTRGSYVCLNCVQSSNPSRVHEGRSIPLGPQNYSTTP